MSERIRDILVGAVVAFFGVAGLAALAFGVYLLGVPDAPEMIRCQGVYITGCGVFLAGSVAKLCGEWWRWW